MPATSAMERIRSTHNLPGVKRLGVWKRVRRAVGRVGFHLARVALRPVEATSPRVFMRLYRRLLTAYGVVFKGEPRYISTRVRFDDLCKVELGDRVVISEQVTLLTHDYSVTTGLIAIGRPPATDVAFIRPITVGRNVFIGMRSLILPGTVIEDDVIVGAGSLVRGRVPRGSIVAGNPARVIGSLAERAQAWSASLEGEQVVFD